jgi:hypothetical protein
MPDGSDRKEAVLKKTTWVLFGVADRDPTEPVLMFFRSREELTEFAAALPGMYGTMMLYGVTIDDFTPHGRYPQERQGRHVRQVG